jgi:hypothetical protein
VGLSFLRLSAVAVHQVPDVAGAQEGEVVEHLLDLRIRQTDEKLNKSLS